MNRNGIRIATVVLGLIGAAAANAATDWSTQDYDLYPGDFDGDGKTDLLYVAKDASKASGIARSDGSAPNIPFQSWPSNYLGIPWSGNQYVVIVADFNGDQKADLLLQRKTAGDHYLLFADANGKISSISQTIADTAVTMNWSADMHRIVAGDFNNDGKADLFFQATRPAVSSGTAATNAVVYPDSNGQFTVNPTQTWTDASWSAFKWSTPNSNIFVIDYNGDGIKDLLIQARPKFVMIDYDVQIPVPTYPPNMNGVVKSVGGVTPFAQAGVQQWSRIANGVDWSPLSANVVIGDFNGDGRQDVLLQARNASRSSYLLAGNASGAAFGTGTALATNVAWSADSVRLVAGNFDGTDGVGVYYQALTSAGTNYYANVVMGGTVTQTAHNPTAATGVLPTTAVGMTAGAFAIGDGGAATYSIPIVVPPGVRGVQPKLSINYASDAGNGLLGVGWGIGGLSAISRCAKTTAQDSSNDGVLLATSDSLCLDGNKLRLTSGAWGTDASTYQTELDSFARVTAHGPAVNGPTWFDVKTKNGTTLEYGHTTDSSIESLNTLIPNTPRLWALNKVTDRAGNSMTFTYQEDGAPNGSFRPTLVEYTANSGASLSVAYRVSFQWETRPSSDALVGYIGGALVRETNRLVAIETLYNDPAVGTWRTVRKYRFSYNASGPTARSRLASVQECDKDSNCLAPTIVSWQEPTYGWTATDTGSTAVPVSASTGLPIDMNGDGRTDFAYFDTGNSHWKVAFGNTDGTYGTPVDTGFGSATNYSLAMPIDIDSDGRRDLIFPNSDNKWWWIHYSGSSFSASTTGVPYTSQTVANFTVADVTGDGRDDILYASSPNIFLHTNQTASSTPNFSLAAAVWTAPSGQTLTPTAFGTPSDPFYSPIQAADFDGDGREDILTATLEDFCGADPSCHVSDIYRWKVLQSTGTALVEKASIFANSSQPTRPMIADVNADGRQDLVYAAGTTPSSIKTWRYRLGNGGANGTGQFLQGEVDTTFQTGASGDGLISDCDADGRTDLLDFWNGTYRCMRSNGETLTAGVDLGIVGPFKVADMNGDGLLDFVYRDAATGNLKIRLHRGSLGDLVSSIADGFGNNVAVQYAPLTDSSVYTKCPISGSTICPSAVTFPLVDVQPAMHVVKSFTATDGIGGTYSVSQKYLGMRVHGQGRGLLGFLSQDTIDGRTGIKTTSTFRQDFPFIGFESKTTTYQPNGTSIISEVVNTAAELAVQGSTNQQRRFPYVQQSEKTTYEVGGVSNGLAIARQTTTQALDSYGNVTNVTTTTADLTGTSQTFQSATVNTYDVPDLTNWCVDFVTRQRVTNTTQGVAGPPRTIDFTKDANAAKCRVNQRIVEPDDTNVKVTTTFGYDSFGHANSETVTALNVTTRTTSMDFGTKGVLPVTMTDALGKQQSKTYDFAQGAVKSATDANQIVTLFDYDGFGRLIRETHPDGTKTEFGYSICNVANGYCGDSRLRYQIEKREVEGGVSGQVMRSSRSLFDSLNRSLYSQTQLVSGAFGNVAVNYDSQGRVAQRSQPYFSGMPVYFTTFTYDLIGRPIEERRRISEANAGTQADTFEYNRLSHKMTDANGKVTTRLLNAVGQVVQMTDAANGITSYEYDHYGNSTKIIDPANNQFVNTYDILGRKVTTDDPDMGHWVYTYYPTGELWTQTNAKLQTVTFTYDQLSRISTRAEPEGTTTFNYGNSAPSHNIGKLTSITHSIAPYSESFTYDQFGRAENATTNIDGTGYVVSRGYNATTGELESITYPTSTAAVSGSRFKVKYEYAYGSLKRVRDFNTPTTIYWEQIATDARAHTLDEQFGNGLHTYSTFDAVNGLLGEIATGATAQVQDLTYQWDRAGNLTQRKDLVPTTDLTEDFVYDNLYRLDYSTLNGAPTPNLDVTYDAIGNITAKAEGASSNTYNYTTQQAGCTYAPSQAPQPHAVRKAGATVYCYDENGNMVKRGGSNITWYSYGLPNRIEQGSNYAQFFYGIGPERSRYKQIAVTASGGVLPAGTETTLYVQGLFEKVAKPSGVIEYKHYIVAKDESVAIRTLRSNSADDTRYVHRDQLGSVDTITNESGTVVARFSYDAFGKRRNAVGWSGAVPGSDWTLIAALTHRGFTDHEELDNVELVHMNGRVYDPNIGRFISADPHIQAPLLSQDLNRYSYVMNNPLSLTDPSGFSFFSKAFSWFSKAWKKLFNRVVQIVATVVVVVAVVAACAYSDGGGCGPATAKGALWLSQIWGSGGGRGGRNPNAPIAGPPFIGFPSALPEPMTAPAGAISLNSSESADSGEPNLWDFLRNAQREIALSYGDNSWALAFWNVFGQSWIDLVRETMKGEYGGAIVAGVFCFFPEMREFKFVQHHIFPQMEVLAPYFRKAKIDIHAWTVRIDEGLHKALHEGKLGGIWNERWVKFFEKNPNASTKEIYEFAAELMDEFEINLKSEFERYRRRVK